MRSYLNRNFKTAQRTFGMPGYQIDAYELCSYASIIFEIRI